MSNDLYTISEVSYEVCDKLNGYKIAVGKKNDCVPVLMLGDAVNAQSCGFMVRDLTEDQLEEIFLVWNHEYRFTMPESFFEKDLADTEISRYSAVDKLVDITACEQSGFLEFVDERTYNFCDASGKNYELPADQINKDNGLYTFRINHKKYVISYSDYIFQVCSCKNKQNDMCSFESALSFIKLHRNDKASNYTKNKTGTTTCETIFSYDQKDSLTSSLGYTLETRHIHAAEMNISEMQAVLQNANVTFSFDVQKGIILKDGHIVHIGNSLIKEQTISIDRMEHIDISKELDRGSVSLRHTPPEYWQNVKVEECNMLLSLLKQIACQMGYTDVRLFNGQYVASEDNETAWFICEKDYFANFRITIEIEKQVCILDDQVNNSEIKADVYNNLGEYCIDTIHIDCIAESVKETIVLWALKENICHSETDLQLKSESEGSFYRYTIRQMANIHPMWKMNVSGSKIYNLSSDTLYTGQIIASVSEILSVTECPKGTANIFGFDSFIYAPLLLSNKIITDFDYRNVIQLYTKSIVSEDIIDDILAEIEEDVLDYNNINDRYDLGFNEYNSKQDRGVQTGVKSKLRLMRNRRENK